MEKKSAPQVSPPRWYGNATSPYTPLDTQRLPRIGCTNDLLKPSPGILGVVLQDGTTAFVEEHDYHLLQARGWTGRWTARKVTGDNTYPSINHGDKIRFLARVILDARKDERVSYRNGDRNDLTRANLILKAKGGKEIGFSNRSCPHAPILSSEERGRVIDRVGEAVGSATAEDRIAVGQAAVRAALPALLMRRGSVA